MPMTRNSLQKAGKVTNDVADEGLPLIRKRVDHMRAMTVRQNYFEDKAGDWEL
jgi:hypothetical protein